MLDELAAHPILCWASLQRVGLLYDIAGAFVLGAAIAFQRARDAAQENKLAWRTAPENTRSATSQVDALTGLVLLVVGFVLQLFGGTSHASPMSIVFITLLPAALAVYYPVARRRFIACRLDKLNGSAAGDAAA